MKSGQKRITLSLEPEIVKTLKIRAIAEGKELNRYLAHASNEYEKQKSSLKK